MLDSDEFEYDLNQRRAELQKARLGTNFIPPPYEIHLKSEEEAWQAWFQYWSNSPKDKRPDDLLGFNAHREQAHQILPEFESERELARIEEKQKAKAERRERILGRLGLTAVIVAWFAIMNVFNHRPFYDPSAAVALWERIVKTINELMS